MQGQDDGIIDKWDVNSVRLCQVQISEERPSLEKVPVVGQDCGMVVYLNGPSSRHVDMSKTLISMSFIASNGSLPNLTSASWRWEGLGLYSCPAFGAMGAGCAYQMLLNGQMPVGQSRMAEKQSNKMTDAVGLEIKYRT